MNVQEGACYAPLGPASPPPTIALLSLDLLCSHNLDLGEMAPITQSIPLHHRWVLFEEKLEVGAGRWSVPHVPTLALPSLQKLRSLLAEGLVLLDCPAQSFLELVGMLGACTGRA